MINREDDILDFLGHAPKVLDNTSFFYTTSGVVFMDSPIKNVIDPAIEKFKKFAHNAVLNKINGTKKKSKDRPSVKEFTLKGGLFYTDNNEEPVFRVRGWGSLKYMNDSEELQECLAYWLLEALKEQLERHH